MGTPSVSGGVAKVTVGLLALLIFTALWYWASADLAGRRTAMALRQHLPEIPSEPARRSLKVMTFCPQTGFISPGWSACRQRSLSLLQANGLAPAVVAAAIDPQQALLLDAGCSWTKVKPFSWMLEALDNWSCTGPGRLQWQAASPETGP